MERGARRYVVGVGCILIVLTAVTALAQVDRSNEAEKYADAGQRALAAGRYAEAQSNFEQLAKLAPDVAEVHATLALIDFKLRSYEAAIQEIHTAQKLKPGLPRLDSLLAISLSESGRLSEALPGLEKCFRQSAEPEIKRMCGLQLMRSDTGLQRDDDAVRVALELNRLYPDDAEMDYYTGKVYGNYAFLTISKLARDAPNSVWRHLAAAEAFESQGSYNEAISEYRAVLATDPNRIDIHYRIGRTLLAQSHQTGVQANIDAARKEFEQELELDPGNGNAAYELAEIHRQAGQLDEAQKYFESAVASYPNFEEAQVGLAATLMAQQKPALALPHLEKAVQLNPDDSVAWYRLAQADRSLGKDVEQRKALAEFQRIRTSAAASLHGPSNAEVTQQHLDPQTSP